MTKLVTTTLFTSAEPEKETALDKTTRIVRRMNEDDAEKRHLKLVRLRNDRFNKYADETTQTSAAASSDTCK